MFWLRHTHVSISELWEHVDFRLLAAYDVVAAPGWRVEFEEQAWTELWLIRDGHCEVAQGAQRALARTGDAVLLRTGKSRQTFNPDNAPLSILGFSFSARLSCGIDLPGLFDLPLRIRPEVSRFRALLESVLEESLAQREGRTFALHGWAQLALAEALRAVDSDGDKPGPVAAERLRAKLTPEIIQVMQFIEAHYSEVLDVSVLARIAHLSDKHFSRRFKCAVGFAPMEYVRDYRLHRAAQRLADNDDSISAIANQTGFANAAHFSRAFRSRFKMTPFGYRQHLRAMKDSADCR